MRLLAEELVRTRRRLRGRLSQETPDDVGNSMKDLPHEAFRSRYQQRVARLAASAFFCGTEPGLGPVTGNRRSGSRSAVS